MAVGPSAGWRIDARLDETYGPGTVWLYPGGSADRVLCKCPFHLANKSRPSGQVPYSSTRGQHLSPAHHLLPTGMARQERCPAILARERRPPSMTTYTYTAVISLFQRACKPQHCRRSTTDINISRDSVSALPCEYGGLECLNTLSNL